jgi:hypothetical protein
LLFIGAIDIFSSLLYVVPGNSLALYLLKHCQNQRPFDLEVPGAEGLLQGGPPGGQVLDIVLVPELGVVVEEHLAVRLVLEPLVAVAPGSLVELEELAGLLEVEAVVEDKLAVLQVLLVKTN